MSQQNYCRRMYLISEAQYKEFYDLKNNEKKNVETRVEQPSLATSSVVNPDTASKIEESLPSNEELPTNAETGTGRKSGNDVKLKKIFSNFIRNENLQRHIENRNWNYLYSKILPLVKSNADLQKSVKIVKNNDQDTNDDQDNNDDNDNNNTQNVNPNDTSWFNDDDDGGAAWDDDILAGLFSETPAGSQTPAQTPTDGDASTNVFTFLESLRKKRKQSMSQSSPALSTPQKLKRKRRESIIASTPSASSAIPSTSADAVNSPIKKTPKKYAPPPTLPKKPKKPPYVKIRFQETPEILGKKSSKNTNKSKKNDDSSPKSGSQRSLKWTNFK